MLNSNAIAVSAAVWMAAHKFRSWSWRTSNSAGAQSVFKQNMKTMETNFSTVTNPFISIPFEWDGTRDKRTLEERYGPRDDYTQEISDEVNRACANFNAVLNHAFAYFEERLIMQQLGPAFSTQEKIDSLVYSVGCAVDDLRVVDRLLTDLARCNCVENERRHLFLVNLHPLVTVGWGPLCQLADAMVVAAMRLEESLICNLDDYTEKCVYCKPRGLSVPKTSKTLIEDDG